VIALSGLDGCGKSSQTDYLQQALSRLGRESVVEWTSIVNQPEAVKLVKRAANVVLGLFRSTHGLGDGPGLAGGSDGDRARALRERSASVQFGWALLLGMTHAVRQRRATVRHLRRGRVVICDRYTLDALVHLRYAYGYRESPATRLQTLVMRRIPPPARLTYFLDVPPEIATARKPDYELADNARRATLYRELCPKYGAIRIDGTRPPEEISALIAREVWRVVA
jgi:thymidylate kinase